MARSQRHCRSIHVCYFRILLSYKVKNGADRYKIVYDLSIGAIFNDLEQPDDL